MFRYEATICFAKKGGDGFRGFARAMGQSIMGFVTGSYYAYCFTGPGARVGRGV